MQKPQQHKLQPRNTSAVVLEAARDLHAQEHPA